MWRSATGLAVSIYPDGQVDPAHNSELALRLPHGSFRLSIAALDKAFVKAASHEPVYPKTCTDLVSVIGTTPIVAGSGTGANRGIGGGFPVTLTLNEVEARPCQPTPGAFRATDHGGRLGDRLVLTPPTGAQPISAIHTGWLPSLHTRS